MSDQRTTLMAKMAAARRRLWLAAVVAVIAGVAAAAIASAQASVALTPAMARSALGRAHVTSVSARELLSHTTITVDPGSGVAVIRVTDARAPRARRLANAYARTLVAAR